MRLAVIVSFLNEARLMPRLLASIERQTRSPDRLVLVDDGSSDGTFDLAAAFAERHAYATALRRPVRTREPDRLAGAAELQSFAWAVRQLDEPWDIVAKLDADLELNECHFESLVDRMLADPRLGVAGAVLSDVGEDGRITRFPSPSWHVRGATKFYRRECYEDIEPIPAHLGWDMIDEVRARRAGWRTESFELPDGDTLHLRPTGQHDGQLRAYRRWGECAWGYGAHPAFVLLGGVKRIPRRPCLAGGIAYVLGYAVAAACRRPRAEREVRALVRSEEARQVWAVLMPRASAPIRPGPASGVTQNADRPL